MTFRCAREKNNHAVACLQAGGTKQAIEMLRQALVDLDGSNRHMPPSAEADAPAMDNDNSEGYCNHGRRASFRHRPTKRMRRAGEATTTATTSPKAPPKCEAATPLSSQSSRIIPSSSAPAPAPARATVTEAPAADCGTDDDDSSLIDAIASAEHHCYMESTPLHICETSDHCKIQVESYLPMYDRALLLCSEGDNYEKTNCNHDHHRDLVTGVILYNMALASHRRGLHEGRSDDLSTALGLYQMCMELLLHSSLTPNTDDKHKRLKVVMARSNLLLMATVYNAAQIHATLLHGTEVRQLLTFCRLILCSPEKQEDYWAVGMDDHVFFYKHVTMFPSGMELCLAPVA